MNVYLLRHGETEYNREHRYQGVSDIPLSKEGEAALVQADFTPEVVYVSPLTRVKRTAELVFPGVKQIPVDDLIEMDFGVFEGRNYMEMENDLDYRNWVEGGCTGKCPGGESLGEYSARVTKCFAHLMDRAVDENKKQLVIVAHGGVQMAVMAAFALPEKPHFDWHGPCAGGFVLETSTALWKTQHKLNHIDTVQYTKEAMA